MNIRAIDLTKDTLECPPNVNQLLIELCRKSGADLSSVSLLVEQVPLPEGFFDYPSLFLAIRNVPDVALQYDLPPRAYWAEWRYQLNKINCFLDLYPDEFSTGVSEGKGGILSGSLTANPLLAAIVQSPQVDEISTCLLKALLLSAAYHQSGKKTGKWLAGCARSFRQFIGSASRFDVNLLSKISEQMVADETAKNLHSLDSSITRAVVLAGEQRRSLDSSLSLGQTYAGKAYKKISDIVARVPAWKAIEVRGEITSLALVDDNGEVEPRGGTLEREGRYPPSLKPIGETVDPEDTPFTYTEPPQPEGELPLSHQGAQAAAERSRFWLYRNRTPSFWQRNALTTFEIEAVEHLIGDLQKESASDCVLISMIWLYGIAPESVPALSIPEDLSLDQGFNKKVGRPIKAFEPLEEQKEYLIPAEETIRLPLPPYLKALIKELIPNSNTSIKLGGLLGVESKLAESRCLKVLEPLKNKGFDRINIYRLRQTCKHRLTVQSDNISLVNVLYGSENEEAPVDAYYHGAEANALIRHYVDVSRELLPNKLSDWVPESSGNEWIGTKVIAQRGKLNLAISEYSRDVGAVMEDEEDFITKHNSLVCYIAAMLIDVAGCRPVDDILSNPNGVNELVGIAIIEDKVVDVEQPHRLVCFPSLVCDQLSVYKKHLIGVSHCLYQVGNTQLAKAVFKLSRSSVRKAKLPFLFTLQRKGKEVSAEGIPIRVVKESVARYHPLPLNLGRHRCSSAPRHPELTPAAMSAQLGHYHGRAHPYGVSSTLVPARSVEELKSELSNYAEHSGWRVVNGLKPKRLNERLFRGQSQIESVKSAQIKRRSQRRDRARNAARVVKMAIAGQFPAGTPDKVSSVDITEIEQAIENYYSVNTEGRKECYSFWAARLYKWHAQRKIDSMPARKIELKPEAGPFSENFPTEYQKAKEAKEKFIQLLNARSRNNQRPNMADHLAECIVAAGLFGALVSKEHLEALPKALAGQSYKVEQNLLVEIKPKDRFPYRWIPASICLALVSRHKVDEGSMPSSKSIERHVKIIMDEILGSDCGKFSYEQLSTVSGCYWRFHLPGHLFAAISGVDCYTPLPLSAIARMVTGARLQRLSVTNNPNPAPVFRRINSPDTSRVSGMESIEKIKQIIHTQRRLFREETEGVISEGSTYQGNKNRANHYPNSRHKKALKVRLKELMSEGGMPSVANAVVCWAIHMCDYGTRIKKDITFGTVTEYLSAIATPLIESAYLYDFYDLDGDEYEEIYRECLEYKDGKARRDLAGNIREFHEYLLRSENVDSVDWPALGLPASKKSPAAANILLPHEYHHALEIILATSNLDELTKFQYAAVLILAFRFGLRRGEIFRLRFRDVFFRDDLSLIAIDVRNNLYGETKTRAGVRYVPLLEKLSEKEIEVLQEILRLGRESAIRDPQAALFSRRNDPRGLIDRTIASKYIMEVIRYVTGDNTFRLHGLRHGWATRTYTYIKDCKYDGAELPIIKNALCVENNSKDICQALYGYPNVIGESLQPISTAIGHASVVTTMHHYIHALEYDLNSAIQDHPVNNSSDRLLAYITGRTRGAINQARYNENKRRARKDSLSEYGAIDPANMNSNIELNIRLDIFPDIDIGLDYSKVDIDGSSIEHDEEVSLIMIDQILRAKLSAQEITNAMISKRLLVSEAIVDKVMNTTSTFGRLDIYDIYPIEDKKVCAVSDRKQVDLDRLYRCLEKLPSECLVEASDESSGLNAGLNIWASTYSHRFGMPLLSTASDVQCILDAMELTGIDRLSNQFYYSNKLNDIEIHAVKSMLGEFGIGLTLITPRRMPAYWPARRGKPAIGIAMQSGAAEFGHQKTLSKCLCLMYIYSKVINQRVAA